MGLILLLSARVEEGCVEQDARQGSRLEEEDVDGDGREAFEDGVNKGKEGRKDVAKGKAIGRRRVRGSVNGAHMLCKGRRKVFGKRGRVRGGKVPMGLVGRE